MPKTLARLSPLRCLRARSARRRQEADLTASAIAAAYRAGCTDTLAAIRAGTLVPS